MKRLLSLLLALILAFSVAMPILAAEAEDEGEGEAITYPALTEGNYNALYVKEGIEMGADFFKMNQYWNPEGAIDYTVPIGPSENRSFWYDTDGDTEKDSEEIYNLTKPEVRTTATVTVDGQTKLIFDIATAEWRKAYREWLNSTFLWTKQTGMRFAEYTGNKDTSKEFAPIQAADGYMQLRSDYNTWGGVLFTGIPALTSSTGELIVSFAKNETIKSVPFLFHQIRPEISLIGDNIEFKSYAANSAVGGEYYITKTQGGTTEEVGVYANQSTARTQIISVANEFAATIENGTANKITVERYTVTANGADVAVFEVKCRVVSKYPLVANPNITIPTGKPFSFTQSIALKDGDDQHTIRTEKGTVASTNAPYEINATKFNNTHYIGWGGASYMKLYAYRHYNRVITDAEIRQNHFADLCKWFRLDVSSLYETVGSETVMTASEAEINFLASMLVNFTFEDDRATVAAALAEAIEAWNFEGEGEGFDAFVADVKAGRIDGASVRALPSKYYAAIYTAYKLFLDANAEADNAARQAAVEAAVASILSTDYADYYNKTPVLTAEAFFTAEAPTTDAAKHFSAIAKENNLDMSLLSSVAPVIRERIYETFADIHAGVYYHTAVLQARLAETTAELVEYYFGDGLVDDVLGFMGYQIRLYGEQSFRAVFSIDKDVIDLLEEHGYTVTVGVLQRDRSDASLEVEKTANGWSAVTPTSTKIAKADQVIVYETGTDYHGDCFEEDGIFRYAYEITPSAKLTDSFFRGYVTIEREGNEDTLFYCETATSSFPKGASITDIAKTAKTKYGMISANIQALTPVKKVIQPTVFVGGENLSFFKVVTDEATKSVTDGFIAAFKAATGATLQAVDAADCVATDKGLIRFAKGDATAIALTDGNVTFTYTDDGAASVAAFAAALAAPEGGYPTFAYGEETPWPVCLFATECTLADAK